MNPAKKAILASFAVISMLSAGKTFANAHEAKELRDFKTGSPVNVSQPHGIHDVACFCPDGRKISQRNRNGDDKPLRYTKAPKSYNKSWQRNCFYQ